MNEQHITFPSGVETLAGTFTRPDGARPHPTALLVAGSGPLDRDGNHKKLALNVSRDLAGELAAAGWASLRFDKRGIGESSGEYLPTGFFDELSDVEAALGFLRGRDDVGAIVPIGHSAGAIQSGEIAARHDDLAGAVLLSTSVKNGDETLRWQAAAMQDVLVPAAAKALLKLFRTSVLKQQAKAIDKIMRTSKDVERIQMVKINAKWMREYIAYEPLPAIRSALVPLLAITGGKDVQVDPDDIETIRANAPAGTEAYVIPDVDHILRYEAEEISNPKRYKHQVANPVDRRVVGAVIDWLQALMQTAPAAEA